MRSGVELGHGGDLRGKTLPHEKSLRTIVTPGQGHRLTGRRITLVPEIHRSTLRSGTVFFERRTTSNVPHEQRLIRREQQSRRVTRFVGQIATTFEERQ